MKDLLQSVGPALILLAFAATAYSQVPTFSESELYKPDLSKYADLNPREGKKKKEKAKAEKGLSSSPDAGRVESWLTFSAFDQEWNYVTDIRADEVEVYLGGMLRAVDRFEKTAQPLDVVFLIDMSPSINSRLKDVRKWVLAVTRALRSEDRVTLVRFREDMDVLLESSNDPKAIERALRKLATGSGTSLYEVIAAVSASSSWQRPRKTVLLISDGVDTTSRSTYFVGSLEAAASANIEIHPVYLDTYSAAANQVALTADARRQLSQIPGFASILQGSNPAIIAYEYQLGREYLTHLLRSTGGRSFSFPAVGADLALDARGVAKALQTRYAVRLTPINPAVPVATAEVRIRVKRPGLRVVTRSFRGE